MKAITIVMFVIILNLSMSVINAANDIDPLFFETKQPYDELNDDLTKENFAANKYLENPGVQDLNQLSFGDYIWGTLKLGVIVGKGVVAIPWLLDQFGIKNCRGCPSLPIILAISSIVYGIYLFGIVQWVANSASK